MSSWFGSVAVAKIYTPDKYYFITPEACEKGFFCIHYAENVRVNENDIKKLERGVNITAIPKELITTLNPSKDFIVKVKVSSHHEPVHIFGEIPLGEVLTNDTLKYPEYLTHAIISAGEPSLDLGKEILILSCGLCIPKFTDPLVMDKLNKALNEVVCKPSRARGSEFTLKRAPAKEGTSEPESELTITVTVSLSADAKTKLSSKAVGNFKLPELPKSEPAKATKISKK